MQVLRWKRLPFLLALGVLGVIVLRNAWMSDDIYITFRTLYNLDHGHGLVWNMTERVQTYTHPLWMLTLAPVYLVVGHAYFVGLGMGMLFSLLAALRFPKVTGSYWGAALCLVLLICSRAYVDFSTSGLENPLSHFLLILFVLFSGAISNNTRKTKGAKETKGTKETEDTQGRGSTQEKGINFIWLGLISSLLLLNRLDHLFLLSPVLIHLFLRNRSWKTLKQLAIGFIPLILWEIFSLIYYGFLFPNTYFAKAMTGFPKEWMLEQGLWYLWDSLTSDFLSLPLIIIVTILILLKGNREKKWLLAGLWLYLGYVVWVGGDFMSGRFITTPFLLAVVLLGSMEWPWKRMAMVVGAFVVISLFHPYHPVYTGKNYYADRSGNERELYAKGIVDEKGMAWQRTSLMNLHRESDVLAIEREFETWGEAPDSILLVQVQVAVGLQGYRSGPNVFIVDELALTDPLLARLPALRVPYWRIGHFFRRLPEGYLASLKEGRNRIADPGLAEYYERVKIVTQGNIWSGERWAEIIRFNLGMNSHLIPETEYQTPTQEEIDRF